MGSDPKGAISLAENIKTPALRIRGVAEISRGLAKTDPARAVSLVDEAESNVNKLSDEQQSVDAIIPIASAWFALGDRKKALSALSRGYSLAAALYKEQEERGANDEDLFLGPAARLFQRLIQTEAEIDGPGSISRVHSRTGSVSLRAAMLIVAARTILEKND
jgi:hypothetical protein